MLFGVFATHSPESCPMNNETSKETFLNLKDRLDTEMKKYIIIIDAIHAHDIEKLCIDTGIASTSIVKIVPLNKYEDLTKKIQLKKR
jgi:hypothetical protein